MSPRQDSVTDQLNDLIKLGINAGLYDAVDWVERSWEAQRERRRKMWAEAIQEERF